jgi:tetratricopeptide (TPR) repeat protein
VAMNSQETTVPMDVSEITSLLQAGRYAELETKVRALLHSHPKSGILWKALSLALTLQGGDAVHASEQAARLMPGDAEAHANLGNALLRNARLEDAAASYTRALEISPRFPEVCNNLGNALRGLGRPDEAVACYRQAIDAKPDFAEAHSNLGNALRGLGRPDQAAASYQKALEIKPHNPPAWNNLGNALFDLGRLGEAAASYRRALEIKPDFAEAHSNLGNTLRRLGQLEEAVASYNYALTLQPGFAGAHSNLGDTLRDLGKLADAQASCGRAVELAPDLAGAHNSLGNVLKDLGKLDEAEASYRRALALEPRFADALINLSLLLRQRGLGAKAEASCRAALAAKPDAAPAFVLLAELRADAGDFAAAEGLFQRAAALDADSPEAWAGMAHLRKMTDSDAAWVVQAQRVAERGLPPRQEVHLRFALGKYFDDVKNYPQAFANFRRAHELEGGYGERYDRRQQTLAVDRLIDSYDGAWARAMRTAASDSARAVFIVGMPRSGTTLAEQILASHPAVFGAGELPFWHDATLDFRTAVSHGKATGGKTNGDIVSRLGGEYLELLKNLPSDAQRVVDKMPANFWCLGLIHEALPNARIIHMQRDPVDTCLSIYFQHFKSALSYADDLEDLAHFYGEYRRIMSHWRATLPAQAMLEVPYESLVAGQEVWSRKMLQFIGLSWDPRCLDFHQTSRSVMTASKWQVRQKMSRSSIERWRNYEQFIGPLLTLLHPPR